MISEKKAADLLARAGRCDGGLTTLVISAREDPLAPYRFATAAVARIAGGRLVTIELGGHQFAGHDAVVGEAISAFVASAGPNSA